MRAFKSLLPKLVPLLALVFCLAVLADARCIKVPKRQASYYRKLSATSPGSTAPKEEIRKVPHKYTLYENEHEIDDDSVYDDPNHKSKRYSSSRLHKPPHGHYESGEAEQHHHHGHRSNEQREDREFEEHEWHEGRYHQHHEDDFERDDSFIHGSSFHNSHHSEDQFSRKNILDKALMSALMNRRTASRTDLLEAALNQKKSLADVKLESIVSRLKNKLAKKIIDQNKKEEQRLIFETIQDRLSQPTYYSYLPGSISNQNDFASFTRTHHVHFNPHDSADNYHHEHFESESAGDEAEIFDHHHHLSEGHGEDDDEAFFYQADQRTGHHYHHRGSEEDEDDEQFSKSFNSRTQDEIKARRAEEAREYARKFQKEKHRELDEGFVPESNVGFHEDAFYNSYDKSREHHSNHKKTKHHKNHHPNSHEHQPENRATPSPEIPKPIVKPGLIPVDKPIPIGEPHPGKEDAYEKKEHKPEHVNPPVQPIVGPSPPKLDENLVEHPKISPPLSLPSLPIAPPPTNPNDKHAGQILPKIPPTIVEHPIVIVDPIVIGGPQKEPDPILNNGNDEKDHGYPKTDVHILPVGPPVIVIDKLPAGSSHVVPIGSPQKEPIPIINNGNGEKDHGYPKTDVHILPVGPPILVDPKHVDKPEHPLPGKPELPKIELPKPEVPRPETPTPELSKPEASKPETPKPMPPEDVGTIKDGPTKPDVHILPVHPPVIVIDPPVNGGPYAPVVILPVPGQGITFGETNPSAPKPENDNHEGAKMHHHQDDGKHKHDEHHGDEYEPRDKSLYQLGEYVEEDEHNPHKYDFKEHQFEDDEFVYYCEKNNGEEEPPKRRPKSHGAKIVESHHEPHHRHRDESYYQKKKLKSNARTHREFFKVNVHSNSKKGIHDVKTHHEVEGDI